MLENALNIYIKRTAFILNSSDDPQKTITMF